MCAARWNVMKVQQKSVCRNSLKNTFSALGAVEHAVLFPVPFFDGGGEKDIEMTPWDFME